MAGHCPVSSHAGTSPTGDERHSESQSGPRADSVKASQLAAGRSLSARPDVTVPIQTASVIGARGAGGPRPERRRPRRVLLGARCGAVAGVARYRQREEALADPHVFEPGEWRRGQGLVSELTETPLRHVLSAMGWLLESGEAHSAWSGNSGPGRCRGHSSCRRPRSTRRPSWCWARWRSCCACCQWVRAGVASGRGPRASWLSVMVWSKR